MTGLRANVDEATAACVPRAALVARLEKMIENLPPIYTRTSHEVEKARARADLETCVALVGTAKAAVGAAEEEGRRAGVPPVGFADFQFAHIEFTQKPRRSSHTPKARTFARFRFVAGFIQ